MVFWNLGKGHCDFRSLSWPSELSPHVAFLSKLLQYCGQLLLTHPNLRGKKREKTLSADKTSHLVFLLCSMNYLPASFLWPLISRIFFFFLFQRCPDSPQACWVVMPQSKFETCYCSENISLYAFAISARLIRHSINFWLWLFSCESSNRLTEPLI